MSGSSGVVEQSPMKEHHPVEHRRGQRANDEDEMERSRASGAEGPPSRRHGGFVDYPYYFGAHGGRGVPPGYPPHLGGRLPPHLEADYYNPYFRRGPTSQGVGGGGPLSRGNRGRSKSSFPPGRYRLGGMGPEREPVVSSSVHQHPPWEERRSRKLSSTSEGSDASETEPADSNVTSGGPRLRAAREKQQIKKECKESPTSRSEGSSESDTEAARDQYEGDREYGRSSFGRFHPGYFAGRGGPPLPGGKAGSSYRHSPFGPPPDHPLYRFAPEGISPEYYHDPYYYGQPDYGDYPPFGRVGLGGGYPFHRPFPRGGGADELDREQGLEGSDKGAISDGACDEPEYGAPPPSHHPAAAEYYARIAGRGPLMRRGGPPPGFAPIVGPYGRFPPGPGPLPPGMRPPYVRGRSSDSASDDGGPPPPHAYAHPYAVPSFYPYRRPQSTESTGDEKSEERGNAVESSTRSRPAVSRTSPSKERRNNDDSKSEEQSRVFCTCKKSRCLKLYCQCFASRQTCQETATDEKGLARCRCRDCRNNTDFESERQEAITTLLQRNPTAFDTKLQEVTTEGGEATGDGEQLEHKVGCKCRRSACLKKYCECFNSKVSCSTNCRCVGCQNNGPGSPSDDQGETSSDSETQSVPTSSYHGSPSRHHPYHHYHPMAMRYGPHGPPYPPPPHHLYDYPPAPPGVLVPSLYNSPSRAVAHLPSAASTPRAERRSEDDGPIRSHHHHPQNVEDAAKHLAQLKKSPNHKKDQKNGGNGDGFASPASVTAAVQESEHTRAVTNSHGSRHEIDSKHSKKRTRKTLPNTPEKKKLSIPSLRGEKESPDDDDDSESKIENEGKTPSNDAELKIHDEGSAGKLMAAMAMTELLGGKGSCPTSPKDDKGTEKDCYSASSAKPKAGKGTPSKKSDSKFKSEKKKEALPLKPKNKKEESHTSSSKGTGVDKIQKDATSSSESKANVKTEEVDKDATVPEKKKISAKVDSLVSSNTKEVATGNTGSAEDARAQEDEKEEEILTKPDAEGAASERVSDKRDATSGSITNEVGRVDSKTSEKDEDNLHAKDEMDVEKPTESRTSEEASSKNESDETAMVSNEPPKQLSEMKEEAKELVAQASKKIKSEIKHILLLNESSSDAKDDSKDDEGPGRTIRTRSKDHAVAPVTSTPPPSPRGALSKDLSFSPGRRTSPRKRKMSDSDLVSASSTDRSTTEKKGGSGHHKGASSPIAVRGKRSRRDRAPVNYTK